MLDTTFANASQVRQSYPVADVEVSVKAPAPVAAILSQTLSRTGVHQRHSNAATEITIERDHHDHWRIHGNNPGSERLVAVGKPAVEVAGAVVSTMIADATSYSSMRLLRATVISQNDRALALLGDDWDATMLLASHLHARAWNVVSGIYSFVDEGTLRVEPFHKLLFATSGSLWRLPLAYRRAVEASPWYVRDGGELGFYAVDPEVAYGRGSWCSSASLAAAVIIDGRGIQRDVQSAPTSILDGLGKIADRSDIRCGRLAFGDPHFSADAIERWFAQSA